MEFTLLSGVVRNRKMAPTFDDSSLTSRPTEAVGAVGGLIGSSSSSSSTSSSNLWRALCSVCSGSAFIRNFTLRVHKFKFKWDLVFHLSVCLASLAPFGFSGNRLFGILPLSVWLFYNLLFVVGTSRANSLLPGIGRFKHAFTASIEEFFSAKLLPVISVCYVLVTLLLCVTGRRLGGPPLCYSNCHVCLGKWSASIPISGTTGQFLGSADGLDPNQFGCGYVNGKELLSYYTIAQTSYTMFVTVLVAMSLTMAWRVAEEELSERQVAEEWLQREDAHAHLLRDEIMKVLGPPGSYIRPEGNAVWVALGVIAALTFTLLGWHNWYLLPPSHTATLIILLNLLTILTSLLTLHLSFFGRLLALYQRNLVRVRRLTSLLSSIEERQVGAWWNCRSFILNDDLGLDYDSAGLAVSATFVIGLGNLVVLLMQVYREGFQALLEPPGSYCAYACLYFTMCLIKIFNIATQTFEEQHRHILGLHQLSLGLLRRGNSALGLSSLSLPFDYYTHNQPTQRPQYSPYGQQDDNVLTSLGPTPAMAAGVGGSSASFTTSALRSVSADYEQFQFLGNDLDSSGACDDDYQSSSSHVDRDDTSNQPLLAQHQSQPLTSSSALSQLVSSFGAAIMAIPASASFGLIDIQAPPHAHLDDRAHEDRSRSLPASAHGSAPVSSKSSVAGGSGIVGSGPIHSLGPITRPTHRCLEVSVNDSSVDGSTDLPLSHPSTSNTTPRASQAMTTGRQPLPLMRSFSQSGSLGLGAAGALEAQRQTLAEMISQIRKYDPFPCILGMPVMPALFATAKFYLFVSFSLIGTRVMLAVLHHLRLE